MKPAGYEARRTTKRVVIISANRAHVERDKAVLRRLSLEVVRTFASAVEAYNYLLGSPCDLLFCDHDVKDLEALHFVRTLKASPSLRRIPVVMVTLKNDKHDVLDAVAAGCAGYILRPYSDETFERHSQTALQLASFNAIEQRRLNDAKLMLETGDFDEAIEEFQELAAMQSEAQRYYDLGCRHLTEERYGPAIIAFQKALRINHLFVQAYEGLAEAYKRKGDIAISQRFLKKAAEMYAEADHMEKVKEIFIDILKVDERAANPYNTLGVRLRKAGDIPGAIRAYTQALEITPKDENIYYNLAKACYFNEDTPQALHWVTQALQLNPVFPEAQQMYRRLKGEPWPATPGREVVRAASALLTDDQQLREE
ncbi:MAG: tetratricopeptide repeat protein [Desulfovibrio sp.]|nr:tetratricopeptide repeat protein [Desulfovibrio sp.]